MTATPTYGSTTVLFHSILHLSKAFFSSSIPARVTFVFSGRTGRFSIKNRDRTSPPTYSLGKPVHWVPILPSRIHIPAGWVFAGLLVLFAPHRFVVCYKRFRGSSVLTLAEPLKASAVTLMLDSIPTDESEERVETDSEGVTQTLEMTTVDSDFVMVDERREWDSNPRTGYPVSGFQDRCIKPLCHPSVGAFSHFRDFSTRLDMPHSTEAPP